MPSTATNAAKNAAFASDIVQRTDEAGRTGREGAQKLRREQSASKKCIHFALYCRVDLGCPDDDDGRGGKKATDGHFHKGGHRTPCIIES